MMPAAAISFLQSVSYRVLTTWDVKHLSALEFNYSFETVPLSQVLSKADIEWVDIEDDKKYSILGVSAQGKGVYINRVSTGKELHMKRYQKSEPFHLYYCKVRTVKGQWGVVYPQYANSYGSSNMNYLKIYLDKLNPEYLELLLKLSRITDEWDKNAVGSAGRHFTLGTLLNLTIPLPSLAEQNRMVDAYNEKMQEAERLEEASKGAEAGIESYLKSVLGLSRNKKKTNTIGLQAIRFSDLTKWSISQIFKDEGYDFKHVSYEVLPVSSVLTFFEGGKTPSKARQDFWGDGVAWVSAKDMKEIYLALIQDQITHLAVSEAKMKIYPPGTLLGVFRSGILQHSFPVAILRKDAAINQDLKAFGVDNNVVRPEYFLYYLRSLQDLILERARKFGVTVESINTDDFFDIPVVVPPLKTQDEIIKAIAELIERAKKQLDEAGVKKIEALRSFEQEIFAKAS